MLQGNWIWALGWMVFLFGEASSALASPVEITSFGSHSRLAIRVDGDVQTSVKESPQGFELLFKGVALIDFGIPLGDEGRFAEDVTKISDQRLSRLEVKETGEGVLFRGQWKFPHGDHAPANPQMQKFEFRDKAPGRYVLDFWVKPGPTVREARAIEIKRQKEAARMAAKDEAQRAAKNRQERKIAREHVEDLLGFCRKPLTDQTDIFIPFYPVREPIQLEKWFPATVPDTNYAYDVPRGTSEEEQHIRLALGLYSQNKYALALRALDFFDKDYPHSKYHDQMLFLRANAYYKLDMTTQGEEALKQLMVIAPEKEATLQGAMFLALKRSQSDNAHAALESLLWLIKHFPKTKLAWVFHWGAAEALFKLKQTEQAAKEYEWITQNAPDTRSKAEGAFRIGDLHLQRRVYDQALAAYFKGITYFSEHAKQYPVVYLNRAETLYWLGEMDRAEAEFRSFDKNFGGHPEGWRATLRLGEIVGRKKGEAAMAESRKWYFDTINRFPKSSGATLARLRLLPCGDHAGMSYEAAQRFFDEEASQLKSAHGLWTEYFPDFLALTHTRSVIALAPEADAFEIGKTYLEASKTGRETRKLIISALNVLFRKRILSLLDEGKAWDAVEFYQDNRRSLVFDGLNTDELEYLMKLSQGASSLGVPGLAQAILADYERYVKAGREVASDDFEKQLRQSEKAFTEAKALWVEQGAAASEKLQSLLNQVIPESPFSGEKEVILGLIDDRQAKPAQALAHALKAQVLLVKNQESKRLNFWIAQLHERVGDPRVSLEVYKRLEKSGQTAVKGTDPLENLSLAPVPAPESLAVMQGEIYTRQSKYSEAIQAFTRAMDYEAKAKAVSNRPKYELARALLKADERANRDQAVKYLEEIQASSKDDLWKKLAGEYLATLTLGRKP